MFFCILVLFLRLLQLCYYFESLICVYENWWALRIVVERFLKRFSLSQDYLKHKSGLVASSGIVVTPLFQISVRPNEEYHYWLISCSLLVHSRRFLWFVCATSSLSFMSSSNIPTFLPRRLGQKAPGTSGIFLNSLRLAMLRIRIDSKFHAFYLFRHLQAPKATYLSKKHLDSVMVANTFLDLSLYSCIIAKLYTKKQWPILVW